MLPKEHYELLEEAKSIHREIEVLEECVKDAECHLRATNTTSYGQATSGYWNMRVNNGNKQLDKLQSRYIAILIELVKPVFEKLATNNMQVASNAIVIGDLIINDNNKAIAV